LLSYDNGGSTTLFIDDAEPAYAHIVDAAAGEVGDRIAERLGKLIASIECSPTPPHEGIFVCTINLMEKLDPASLRRFAFKVRFDPLICDQCWSMFCQKLGRRAGEGARPVPGRSRLGPGDFNVAARQFELRGHAGHRRKVIRSAAPRVPGEGWRCGQHRFREGKMTNMLMRTLVVRQCSACSDFLYQYSRRKESVWIRPHYTLWTDGKISHYNQIADPELVLCPHCHALIWINEMVRCGEIRDIWQQWWGGGKIAFYKEPTLKDYASLLEQGAGSQVKEHYTRLALWWTRNDARRRPTSSAPGPGFRERANMTALAELLNEADSCDRVVKAELMREMGFLDDARALLERPVDDSLRDMVEVISWLIDSGDTRVAEVRTSGGPLNKGMVGGVAANRCVVIL